MILMDNAHDTGRGTVQLFVIDDSPSYNEVPLQYFLQRFPVDMVVSYLQLNIIYTDGKIQTRVSLHIVFFNI